MPKYIGVNRAIRERASELIEQMAHSTGSTPDELFGAHRCRRATHAAARKAVVMTLLDEYPRLPRQAVAGLLGLPKGTVNAMFHPDRWRKRGYEHKRGPHTTITDEVRTTAQRIIKNEAWRARVDPRLVSARGKAPAHIVVLRWRIIHKLHARFPHLTSGQLGKLIGRDRTYVLYALGKTKRAQERPYHGTGRGWGHVRTVARESVQQVSEGAVP